MKLNTTKSIERASKIYHSFGSWKAVRSSSELKNGVYVVNAPAKKPAAKAVAAQKKAG